MQWISNGLRFLVMCSHQVFKKLSLINIMGKIRLRELESQHCQTFGNYYKCHFQ
jgi:hypothetical protein